MERPSTLADMTITKGPPRGQSRTGGGQGGGGGGGGGHRGGNRNDGGGGDWSRGSAPPKQQNANRQNSGGGGGGQVGGGGGDWSRGQAPPKQQQQDNRGGGGRGGGRNNRGGHGQQQPLYDGPVAPLDMSENRWRPTKNTSVIIIAEKKVKSILNKMTKEKFTRLATQMIEIPIISYEMLSIMIENVYDKAIDEPTFGDMYADLCVMLSQSVKGSEFVHIIKSDEEPQSDADPSTDASNGGESSSYTVYRWSNDVSTTDAEIVGPFASEDDCLAISAEQEPMERGEMELDLVSVSIRKGVFTKVMKKKTPEEGETDIFYAVFFPASEMEQCGQQVSNIFLSEVECRSDATKKNSFKSSLLNKCENEFNKQDIYVDWKAEKKGYEETKSTMTPADLKEKASDLNFRRIKIKKQMLGNIKFIGQLFKKGLLKEKIMRYCIASLMKLELLKDSKGKNPEYKDSGDSDMDEEDHEAICSMFATVGQTLELPHAVAFMKVCFGKIKLLSDNEGLPSRSRFMYKDLLELRANRWVPRRKEEKAKTLEEIRKDVEKEERRQKQESQRGGGGYNNSRGGGGDYRGGGGNRQQSFGGGGRPRQPKAAVVTDDDGFTTIAANKSNAPAAAAPASSQSRPVPAASSPKRSSFSALAGDKKKATKSSSAPAANAPAPLSDEALERSIKSMRTDFTSDGGNIDELMLSWKEMAGTPGAGAKLVSKNADRLMECKDDERSAINKIFVTLVEKKILTSDDVKNGLMDAIEFIDSCVMDSPRAFEYLGDVLGALLVLKAIDVAWICEQLAKTKVDNAATPAPVKVIRFTIAGGAKSRGGSVADDFKSADKALTDLLGADSWKTISQEL